MPYNRNTEIIGATIKILFLILCSTILFAQNYPNFTDKELQQISKNSGKIAKNRVLDYVKQINTFKKHPKDKQLIQVNLYLNKLLPQYDAVIKNKEEHWATPKEFLITGYGDCEDYAIIKYFTLIKLGFEEEKLFLTSVKDKYSGGHHMVLSYFQDRDKSPLVLDNLSFKILSLQMREDLEVDIFINSYGVFKINKDSKLVKKARYAKRFTNLLKKIKVEQ
ncbi:MAG: transglutaminase-like cysteine peptidase [Sulfurimonas sp.]|nr:transglutaminase-like cysteine peptidase [Sulfurimonas sp.]